MGAVNPYEVFRERALRMGLEVRECTDCHWQVKAGGVTVNVWPLNGGIVKYLLQGSPAGAKARVGSIDEALKLCGRKAAATPPINGKPKPATNDGAALAAAGEGSGIRSRATIIMDEGGAFTVISHGDAIETLTFDEMLGVVVNLFHTPKQKTRAESLFAMEKSFRRRHPEAAELPV